MTNDLPGQPHIAPPTPAGKNISAEQVVTCPFCHSTDTEPMALFGSQLSTAQYYCRACHTPFERMKQEPLPNS